jgi:hypothetical protein
VFQKKKTNQNLSKGEVRTNTEQVQTGFHRTTSGCQFHMKKKIISSYKQVSRNKIRSKLVLLLIFVVKELQKLIREFAHAAQVELSKAEDTGEFSPRSTREVQGYFYSFPRQKKGYMHLQKQT